MTRPNNSKDVKDDNRDIQMDVELVANNMFAKRAKGIQQQYGRNVQQVNSPLQKLKNTLTHFKGNEKKA